MSTTNTPDARLKDVSDAELTDVLKRRFIHRYTTDELLEQLRKNEMHTGWEKKLYEHEAQRAADSHGLAPDEINYDEEDVRVLPIHSIDDEKKSELIKHIFSQYTYDQLARILGNPLQETLVA